MRTGPTSLLFLLAGCGPTGVAATAGCEPPQRIGELPPEIEQASGLAISRAHTGVFWTHNDSGHDAALFAIDSTGALLGRVAVSGAGNADWEDIAFGPCDDGPCLYIGDIGDNREVRDEIVVYRVREPAPEAGRTETAEAFRFRYPDGPRDAEALFVTADARVFIVSKGRSDGVHVFAAALPAPDGVATLEVVQSLTDVPQQLPQQVTGASLAPDGRTVVVRTYASLRLYRFDGVSLRDPLLADPGLDLAPLAEPQGEAVDVRADGAIFLASEAGGGGIQGPLSRTVCRF